MYFDAPDIRWMQRFDQKADEAMQAYHAVLMNEMQFPRAAIMVVDVPSDTEPYYTIKAGSNMEDRFVTNYWFHVYVQPTYAIKVYDVVSDSELSLEEWRKEKEKYSKCKSGCTNYSC